jgi:hypothetical protein
MGSIGFQQQVCEACEDIYFYSSSAYERATAETICPGGFSNQEIFSRYDEDDAAVLIHRDGGEVVQEIELSGVSHLPMILGITGGVLLILVVVVVYMIMKQRQKELDK